MDAIEFEITSEELLRSYLDLELNRQFDGFDFNTNFVNSKIEAKIYFQTVDGEVTDENIKINYANGLAVYTLLDNE